jgi:RecA/RadA recombinase
MAKKEAVEDLVVETKDSKSKKAFSFDDLNKEMSKFSILGERMDKSEVSKVDRHIHSGNYMLNACLSGSIFKGYPGNRSICVAGPSGTGKTFLMLNAVKNAQEAGEFVIWYDSENAIDQETLRKFNIDLTKFRYEPCGTVQDFRTSITKTTDILIEQKRKGIAIPKLLIILDSAGNLATQKEIDDAASGSEKSDMTRAKVLKSIFRIMMTRLAECKATFLFSNHTYLTQGMFASTVGGGGTGIEYSASIILFLSKAQNKEDEGEGAVKTGIVVTVTPNKNRFAKPSKIKFIIHFTRGMNAYVGLEKYITWDSCGIDTGKLLTQKEFDKQVKDKLDINKEKDAELLAKVEKTKFVINETITNKAGELEQVQVDMYFINTEDAKSLGIGSAKFYVCKHLGRRIETSELFTPIVITQEVLEMLDPYIRAKFEYSSLDAMVDESEAILEDIEDEVEVQ